MLAFSPTFAKEDAYATYFLKRQCLNSILITLYSAAPPFGIVLAPQIKQTGGLLLTTGGMGPAASQERDQRNQVGSRRKTKGQPKAQVQRQGREAQT